jgi:hypothetical protein
MKPFLPVQSALIFFSLVHRKEYEIYIDTVKVLFNHSLLYAILSL